MSCLRALITVLILLPFESAALAETQSVTTLVGLQNISGTIDPANLTGQTQTSQVHQSIQYQIEGVLPGLAVSGAINRVEPDYSSYLTTGRDGTQASLASRVGNSDEYSGSFGMDWNSGPHGASLRWDGALNGSPFAIQSLTAGYVETFYNKTTSIGAKVSVFQLSQPENFFIDSDFVTQARPTLIHGNQASACLEQVLTERWKGDLEFSSGIREEDRPRNLGATIKQGYALTDRLFSQMVLSDIQELRSEALKNERGYFSLRAAELALTFEPVVDLLLSSSYGYVVESESDPRSGREVQVGSDQYGLGVKYRRGAWSYESKAAYRLTNTGLYDLGIEGGLTWRI